MWKSVIISPSLTSQGIAENKEGSSSGDPITLLSNVWKLVFNCNYVRRIEKLPLSISPVSSSTMEGKNQSLPELGHKEQTSNTCFDTWKRVFKSKPYIHKSHTNLGLGLSFASLNNHPQWCHLKIFWLRADISKLGLKYGRQDSQYVIVESLDNMQIQQADWKKWNITVIYG